MLYVGPGAGFAFLGSFLSLLISLLLTAASFLIWPFRTGWAMVRRGRGYHKARVKRLIFLGLDGLDPGLTERFMAEGVLPNLRRLREQGSFHRLRTTFPALSPVAWSTFATGVSPAKHNIFDFLNRSLKSYLPELSSAKVNPPRRVLKIGRWQIPISRPTVEMRRKSRTFWSILGDRAIRSTIIRVPITFPPEKFKGQLLSAMATPDLRGTQGSFSRFSAPGPRLEGWLEGPQGVGLPFRAWIESGSVLLEIDGQRHRLKPGEYSPWIRLRFRAAPLSSVYGIARFLITSVEPELSLYVTPVQIDPEAPALPISHPGYYAAYLAKLLGTFATVGMAEDTSALNEGAIDEAAFLDQAYSILAEREAMFENALVRTRHGVVACVVDTSDRVQHMFYRHLDTNPAPIRDLYVRMDALVGKAMQHVDQDTILFVLSDHGFCHFRRAVNLNTWLMQNGYLSLNDAGEIDWRHTRAYCVGLSGLYLNLRGREAEGIEEDAAALKNDLIAKLSGLPDGDRIAIRQLYATDRLYRGPYLEAAPDLIIGYNAGYRVSWDAALGKVAASVIEDNPKPWSGDHCVDPVLVPGVLFCSRPIQADDPGIEDMAPTALQLFGIDPPAWMDGKPVTVG